MLLGKKCRVLLYFILKKKIQTEAFRKKSKLTFYYDKRQLTCWRWQPSCCWLRAVLNLCECGEVPQVILQLVLALRVKQGPGNTPECVCMYGREFHMLLFIKVVLTGFAELINIWFVCSFQRDELWHELEEKLYALTSSEFILKLFDWSWLVHRCTSNLVPIKRAFSVPQHSTFYIHKKLNGLLLWDFASNAALKERLLWQLKIFIRQSLLEDLE